MTQQRRALELFKRASDVPETEIGDFLDQQCLGDVGLRQQIEKLLSVRNEARNLFPEDASPPPLDNEDVTREV